MSLHRKTSNFTEDFPKQKLKKHIHKTLNLHNPRDIFRNIWEWDNQKKEVDIIPICNPKDNHLQLLPPQFLLISDDLNLLPIYRCSVWKKLILNQKDNFHSSNIHIDPMWLSFKTKLFKEKQHSKVHGW